MAKFVFGMNQSLDGYVDHPKMRRAPAPFRHWLEQVRGLTGSVYGRRMYEAMAIGTKTTPSGMRSNMSSRRRGGASRSGSCHVR